MRHWTFANQRLGTEGLITERAVYADVLASIWKLQQSGSDPAALRDAYSKLLLMLNLAENLPGGTFRGVQLYLWNKRGVFKTLVSRHYGKGGAIPASPITSELKLSDDAIATIEYCFEGLAVGRDLVVLHVDFRQQRAVGSNPQLGRIRRLHLVSMHDQTPAATRCL